MKKKLMIKSFLSFSLFIVSLSSPAFAGDGAHGEIKIIKGFKMKSIRLIAMIGFTLLQWSPIYSIGFDRIIDRAQDGQDGINGQNGENGKNGAIGQHGGNGGKGGNGGNGDNGRNGGNGGDGGYGLFNGGHGGNGGDG